ncbi:MAG TPA: Ig-like domain repeat protein [Candidatus Acidoferrum sp.]|nr:Ig-like domain repeat protein [Candidatus Acidoferrum sp.]
MKLQSLFLRTSLLLSAAVLTFCCFAPRARAQSNAQTAAAIQAPAVSARITQAIDDSQLVRLKGNVHPLARPEFDQGPVADSTPMKRILLLLQRSPEQEAALQQFMAEQMSNESLNFHKWLTPQQFGALYGPADSDIQTVTSWLASHGFTAIRVAPGKSVIEVSGNAGQVRLAFHTEIHRFLVNGEERQSNTSDPQIPVALTPVVAGIVSLHNFPSKSMRRSVGAFMRTADGRIVPEFTTTDKNGNTFYAVGPADFAKIYNIPASLDGTGGNIAIIGFSDIDVTDAHDFRALFNLPVNDPVVVNNGPDPGFNGEEGEADLDTQWAGAVAPKATIHYVLSEGTLTSDPLFLGAEYVIDNNSDDVMSLSFGNCEPQLSSGALSFLNNLWEQAAAQGITVTVSAGDNGSAGCDDFNTQASATLGIAVSGIASTPFNIAVGGTDFDDVGTQPSFWSATNSTDGKRESALGYIHEIPWNDSCAAAATSSNVNTICASPNGISAGSGGPSAVYPKPAWQNGIIPNGIAAGDNHRYLPDVSLFASDGPSSKSFYVICQADAFQVQPPSPPSCVPDASGHFQFFGAGGTSASAPSFAAIIALIGQSEAGAGRSRRQGNANVVLYKIAQTAANSCNSSTQPAAPPSTCVFYNITKNTNSVPCAGNSPNCSSKTSGPNGVLVTASPAANTPAFNATAGSSSIPTYNLATGLGSVNVANLATAWGTNVGSFKGSSSTLLINNSATPAAITHGTAVTAKVTVAAVAPATGTPSGDVSVLAPSTPTGSVGSGNNGGTLSSGVATISGVILPGGSYNVTAHYAGDTAFSPSDSPVVPITVSKENSRLQYSIVTFDPVTGNITNTNATTFGYGSPYILRFDILNSTTNACTPLSATPVTKGCAIDATGTVTITDNGSPLTCSPLVPGCTSPFPVNSEGSGENQPIQLTGGSHTLSATYSGDNSYNPVATPVVDMVTVTPATTSSVMTAGPNPVPVNQQVMLSVTISSQSNSAQGPAGSVTFKDGSTTIGTARVTPAAATSTAGASGTASMSATFTTTGAHSLTAVYGGDTNYATSTTSAVSLTVGQTTTTTVTSSTTTISSGGSITFTATVVGTGTGASPTGTVQFMNAEPGSQSAPLGAPQTCTAVSGATSPTCKATLTTTLAFLVPPSGPKRMPKFHVPWIFLIGAVLLILLLYNLKRVPPRYRRAYATACFLLLAGFVAGLATGCGKNYGGGGGTHYDTITAVYSGDTTYTGSTSSGITITVQ